MKIDNVKGLLEVLHGDTRNAMHSILGFLELVSEGALDREQREFIEACRAEAEQQCRGIEDVRLILGLIPEERQAIADFIPQNFFSGVAEVIRAMPDESASGFSGGSQAAFRRWYRPTPTASGMLCFGWPTRW
jgi:hypothetical protein